MRFRVRPPSPWPQLATALPPAGSTPPTPASPQAKANSFCLNLSKKFLLPGATAAVLVMLGALHARRMYDDKKASFLRLLPLRSLSRFWGSLMEVDIPVLMRPSIYKAWARTFNSDLQEVALPLEDYPSLQAFFIRSLKEGARPIDPDQNCLVSPVDGKVLRLGKLRGPGTMIEQVKGFSYPVSSLLGTSSSLHDTAEEELSREHIEQRTPENSDAKSWWRVSVASPKLRDQIVLSPKKDIFYCVIYLHPGDYHRVHSPVDCNILKRRHFSGLSIPPSYVVTPCRSDKNVVYLQAIFSPRMNVLYEPSGTCTLRMKGWKEGFVAIAAIGATNAGSVRVNLEPELRTNRAVSMMMFVCANNLQIAGFKMGLTVVLVFEAPAWKPKARQDATVSSGSA